MQLFDRLERYANSDEVRDIQAGLQAAVDELLTAAGNAIDGAFVASATNTLSLWEELYGIEPNASLPDAQRREIIRAKMRSAGTTTPALIELVAESYVNGDVAVTEQPADYTFTITFISTKGRPPLLDSLKAAIEKIKPAHLGVIYVFVYITHGEIAAKPYTHAQLAAYTHYQIRNSLEV